MLSEICQNRKIERELILKNEVVTDLIIIVFFIVLFNFYFLFCGVGRLNNLLEIKK